MAINGFPIQAGQKVTAELLNQLVASIQDGSIFTSVSFVSDLVTTLDTRVAGLEGRVSVLELRQSVNSIREQLTPFPGQTTVILAHAPVLDTEFVFLNGVSLAKNGIPLSFSGDYTVSGNILTFQNSLALTFVSTDEIVIVYQYGV